MERQYSDYMLQSMQATYGSGFLSPGAEIETRQMLEGFDITGKVCLDLGCGVGGACFLMAKEYSPESVIGVDVQQEQLSQAQKLNAIEKFENVDFKLVNPNENLPFPDNSFDLVITKDVICHVKDKTTLFKDVHRVLKPNGLFVVGDWHQGKHHNDHPQFTQWLDQLSSAGLIFFFETAENYKIALSQAGFEKVIATDHTQWSRDSAKHQYELAVNENRESTIASLGEEAYNRRVLMTKTRHDGLDNGSIDHWHIRGYKLK